MHAASCNTALQFLLYLVHGHHVGQPHAQVLAHDLVDADLGLLHCVVCQHDAHGVLPLLSLQNRTEQAKDHHPLHVLQKVVLGTDATTRGILSGCSQRHSMLLLLQQRHLQ